MGLFGWVDRHIVDPVVNNVVKPAWHGLEDAGKWVAKRWKPIVAALVAGVVFGGVFLLCPAFGPALIAEYMPALVAGLASGAAGQATRDWFNGKTPGTDVIVPALLSAGLSVGGVFAAQIGSKVPLIANNAILSRLVSSLAATKPAGTIAAEGAADAGGMLQELKEKALFLTLNVTPGPSDVVQIIENPRAHDIPVPPLPELPRVIRSNGLVKTLDKIGQDGPDPQKP